MSTGKGKTWKRYFIEFLMLFLAVTLGFVADNYGESISERSKEKEYILSMIEDVKEDQNHIAQVITTNTKRSGELDLLIKASFKGNFTTTEINQVYKYLFSLVRHPEFLTPTELTMQQLKNAGGMRLIKSKESINEIIRYDSKAKEIANQQMYYENYQNKAIDISTEIFNIQELILAIRNHPDFGDDNEFSLINDDQTKLKEFGNSVAMFKGIIEYYVRLLEEMDTQGEVLIQTLKKAYKLD